LQQVFLLEWLRFLLFLSWWLLLFAFKEGGFGLREEISVEIGGDGEVFGFLHEALGKVFPLLICLLNL
jgi:hypothetical protein